jgi:hypothetical protein
MHADRRRILALEIAARRPAAPGHHGRVGLSPENREPLDYYLLPRIDVPAGRRRLAMRNGISLDAYRFSSRSPSSCPGSAKASGS